MGALFGLLTQDRDTSILMMGWANEHPYLFTLIQVANPIMLVILVFTALNLVNGLFRRRDDRWQRGR